MQGLARLGQRQVTMQVVWSSRRGSRSIEHIGSAHDEPVAVPAVRTEIVNTVQVDQARPGKPVQHEFGGQQQLVQRL
jgi:hypothetical protein